MIRSKIELFFHLLFWIFIISSINIDWTANWFDPAIRPNTPAPLSLVIFVIYFYVNAYVLIPKYFAFESWKKYVAYAFLLFVIPELIRIGIYKFAILDTSFERALFSRDSFFFGTPSPFFFALNLSFIYSLTKGWFLNKNRIRTLQDAATKKKTSAPYKNTILLSNEEASKLEKALLYQLETEKIYLNPELTLRDLADKVGSTEKKLSYLINQNLKTNYYELINTYRVEKFKTEVAKSENKSLSLVGLALNCGFPSKSSFYRAFKSKVAMSPSEYVKNVLKSQ